MKTAISVLGLLISFFITHANCNDYNSNLDALKKYSFLEPPVISSQPTDQNNVCVGSDVSYSITGSLIDSYQWQVNSGSGFSDISNGGVYSNATTSILNITGVTVGMDAYEYRCVLTNAGGSTTSDAATLNLETTAPTITSSHSDKLIGNGSSCSETLPDYTGSVVATDNCGGSLTITQSPVGGTVVNGNTTVTLIATDGAGNSSDISFNVQVVDNESPVIWSVHDDDELIASANCDAILPDYTASIFAMDNCDVSLTVSQNPTAGTVISTTTVVTLTVTDDASNTDEVSFTVTLVDNISPEITSTHNDKNVMTSADCDAILPDYTSEVVATDNCDASLTVSQSPAAGTLISTATVVTLTVTDDADNTDEVSFSVSIIDNITPQITSTHTDKRITTSANCDAVLPDYTSEVIATDNCDASLTVGQSPAAGTLISATTVVTLTVTDDASNTDEVSFNVSLVDNTAPDITSTHNDKNVMTSADCDAILPDYTSEVVATDNCDASLTVSQSPAAGTLISTTTVVTLKVTDDAGNTDEVSFNVSLVDNISPEITSTHSDKSITASANCDAVLPDYTSEVIATDNCDASLTVGQSPAAGTLISATTVVTLTVTDDAGNTDEVSFNVSIIDNITPEITSTHDDDILELSDNCEVTIPDYTTNTIATDNCDSDVEITQVPVSGTIISSTTKITLTATDDAGNTDHVSFDLKVSETSTPTFTCPLSQFFEAGDLGYYTVNGAELDLTDISVNCGTYTISNDFNNSESLAGESLPIGTTSVQWTVTDEYGNSAKCNVDIEVSKSTGLKQNNAIGASLYPNPSDGVFEIKIQSENFGELSIKVISLAGKTIVTKQNITEAQIKLDLSDYPKGVYYVQITNNKNLSTLKVILQ